MDDLKNTPSRVDGRAKVTGKATYIAEFDFPNIAHGCLVPSTIAKGKIAAIDTVEAEKQPGVIKVLTHKNVAKLAAQQPDEDFGVNSRPFFALTTDTVLFSGQPVAVVVAETFEQARYAASLVKVEYTPQPPSTDTAKVADKGFVAGRARPVRGMPDEAFAAADVKIDATYTIPIEHHNAMEPHATVAHWDGSKLTVYDKTQGVDGVRNYLSTQFGIPKEKVNVLSPFVGGAFGAALRPTPNTLLAVMASREVKRPVKLVYSRRQLATAHGYRPASIQKIKVSADKTGKLTSIIHEAVHNTSSHENFSEDLVGISRTLYACPNVRTDAKITRTDLQTPLWMRAPGTVSGAFALESALDELSYLLKIDPLELRLINYAEKDPDSGKPFSSKELRECYRQGAEKFGWKNRKAEPRSTRQGRYLIGHGLATGTWGAFLAPSSARVTLKADGTALVESGATDIGPGTYTTISIIAAKQLGLPIEKVKFVLGDSDLPTAPSQGGSVLTASVGTAVQECAQIVQKELIEFDSKAADSMFAGVPFTDIVFERERVFIKGKPEKTITIPDILKRNNLGHLAAMHTTRPDYGERGKYATASHGAQFVEVKVDEEIGKVFVTRVVQATAAGKVINPKGAHSQEMGGVVWGVGMALMEHTEVDHRIGRIMNPNLGGYHVPVNADIGEIETIFVPEEDKIVNPLGVKGLGELGLVGIPAAIANAIYNATGKRIRDLPITPDKLI
jgi:Aerobic-type carbon monoxide dehydrogenase, large subunit CoxL/CutL homologs